MRSGAATENGASQVKGTTKHSTCSAMPMPSLFCVVTKNPRLGAAACWAASQDTNPDIIDGERPGERGVKKRYPLVHLRLPSPNRPAHCLAAGWGSVVTEAGYDEI